MRRIKCTVSYDGTDFHGWQVQPDLATIQGTLESAVSEIENAAVQVAGSGRTDAGVHAIAQVAAFSLANPIPLPNLKKAVNRLLPPSIRVTSVEETHSSFHPRFDATAKTYQYRIHRGESCPPWEWRYVYAYPYPLDGQRIVRLAPLLEGEHDFSCFAAADDRDVEGGSKVRTIYSSRVEITADRLTYTVRGSGFLKHMVRNIVGTLLEAGKGNLDGGGLLETVESRDRMRSGPTAPAKGLFLVSVEYD